MTRLARRPSVPLAVLTAAVLLSAAASAGDRPPRERHAAPLFASTNVLDLTLTAPLGVLFARAEKPPGNHAIGTLSYLDPRTGQPTSLDGIEVSVRGNTSRRENQCSFPKLKLRFPRGRAVDASIFSGLRSLKVGTHCGELPDGQLTAQFGRWANEKSPIREGLVYRLLQAAEVQVPATRLARITYVDRAAGAGAGVGPRASPPPKTRSALLLEDDTDAMARLGAIGELIVPGGEPAGNGRAVGTFENAERQFSPADSVRVAFAQAMIGNFDWGLKFNASDRFRDDGRKGLWNVLALARRDGTAFPLVHDFDLCGIVTGRHPWYGDVFPDRFAAADTQPAVEVIAQVQRARSLFGRAVLDAARAEFLSRKEPILAVVDEVPVDVDGAAVARRYLNAFFDAIESDASFYRPVVARGGAVPYADGTRSRPACGDGDAVPVGSPVTPPADLARDVARVEVLDIFWHWAEGRCKAIRQGPVWIDPAAVERAYPGR